MSIRLTILCENSVERVEPAGLLGEHGFACHLQSEQVNFLFDCGGGQTLLPNAERLGSDLHQLDGILLSHGHSDHTGGLRQALQRSGPLPVYGHPELFRPRFSNNGGERRSIGLPFSRAELEQLGADFRLSHEPQVIAPGITLSGAIPRRNRLEIGDPKLQIEGSDGQPIADPMADDLSLFIETAEGLIILLGCAHAGVLNIIERAREITGQKKIRLLLGGTHLKFCSEQQLELTLDALAELEIEQLATSHCTGLEAAQRLKQRFGAKVCSATVGKVFVIG